MTEAREIDEIIERWEMRVTYQPKAQLSPDNMRRLIADWRAKKAEIDELRERLFDAESNARDRWD